MEQLCVKNVYEEREFFRFKASDSVYTILENTLIYIYQYQTHIKFI